MKTKNTVYTFEQVTDAGEGKLIITGITSSLDVKYVELEYCKEFLGKSEKTCRREIAKLKSKSGGIQKKYWGRAIIIQGKTFVSRFLIEKAKKKRSKKTQKLIQGYIEMLSKYNWKIAGSIRYKWDKTLEEVRKIMEDFNLSLQKRIDAKFTLFYVLEANDPLFSQEHEPHHIHYMIAFDEKIDLKRLKFEIALINLPMEPKDYNYDWCETYKKGGGYVKYCANKVKPSKDNYYIFPNEERSKREIVAA